MLRPSLFLPAWPPLPAVHEKPTRAVRPAATEEGDRGVAASDAAAVTALNAEQRSVRVARLNDEQMVLISAALTLWGQ